MLLFKKCDVYAPESLGRKDVLVAGSKIISIEDEINLSDSSFLQIINCDGLKLIPGLVDAHVHIAGAGGEGGPSTRTPELQLSMLVEAGVTTVIGCLGTDGMTRSVESVLMKAKGLRAEGVSCWIYTGAYQVPTPTITGEIGKDIATIEEIIGVGEIAVSDHRSSWPTTEELTRITEHARVGGMLGGKAGIVNIHLGDQETDQCMKLLNVVRKCLNLHSSYLHIATAMITHLNLLRNTVKKAAMLILLQAPTLTSLNMK